MMSEREGWGRITWQTPLSVFLGRDREVILGSLVYSGKWNG